MPAAKGYRSTPPGANIGPAPLFPVVPSSTASGSRVTVTAVPVKRPSVKPSQSQSRPSSNPASSHPNAGPARPVEPSAPTLNSSAPRPDGPLSGNQSLRVPERCPLKPPNAKKDPMAALFMPKKRAFSQLPTDSDITVRPQPRDPTSASLLSERKVPECRPLKPPNAKKDPMAALFMPKERAFSQLPTDSSMKAQPQPRNPTSAGLPSERKVLECYPLKPPSVKKYPMTALSMPDKRAFSQLPTDSDITSRPQPRDPTSASLLSERKVPERRPLKPPNSKKDPMAALPMPNKCAFSQLPIDSGIRAQP